MVWVLGAPPSLPKGFQWDSRPLERRLSTANYVITPAIYTASLIDIFSFMRLRRQMRSKAALEDVLPPDLRARFLAPADMLHQKPGRYDRWNALFAGALMREDFYTLARLDRNEPLPAISKLVHAHGLKSKPAATYKAVPVFNESEKELNSEVEQMCLSEALDEIEGGSERQTHAAEGWSQGNVRLTLTGAQGFEHCLDLLPEGARMSRQAIMDEAGAISASLEQTGVAVAVVPIRQLLAENGVLEQLRAKGYSIRAPDR